LKQQYKQKKPATGVSIPSRLKPLFNNDGYRAGYSEANLTARRMLREDYENIVGFRAAVEEHHYQECHRINNKTVEIHASAMEEKAMTEDERRRLNKMEARFAQLTKITIKQFEERIHRLENDITDLRIQIVELGQEPCA